MPLDPGGIGKGLAADLIVADLRAAGCITASVSVGGDVAVWGDVTVRVAPGDTSGGELTAVHLGAGGVATSGGRSAPYLLDPATARPVRSSRRSPVAQATVAAASAAGAEVLATTLCIDGPERWLTRLDRRGVGAFVVLVGGTVVENESWSELRRPVGGRRRDPGAGAAA